MLSFRSYIQKHVVKLTEDVQQNPVEVDAFHGSGKRFGKFAQSQARIKNDHMGGGIGYFTTNKDVARSYANHMAKYHKTNTPYIYHTKLKMNNVFDVDHDFHGDKLKHLIPDEKKHEDFARGAGLLKLGADKYKTLSDLKSGNIKLSGQQVFNGLARAHGGTAGARDHLIKRGYDGLRYNGGEQMDQATKHDVYIPYNADSIHIHKITQIVKKKPESE